MKGIDRSTPDDEYAFSFEQMDVEPEKESDVADDHSSIVVASVEVDAEEWFNRNIEPTQEPSIPFKVVSADDDEPSNT